MKETKNIFALLLIFLSIPSFGQEKISEILATIEENNPTIAALRAHSEYAKAEVRADLFPSNPEFEFGRFPAVQGAGVKYAWGVSQHFEFPTVYSKRSQLVKTTDRYANAAFLAARQEILVDAKITVLELVNSKRILTEISKREALARNILAIIQKKLDAGEASAMDLNNAKLRVAEATHDRSEMESSIGILNRRLFALNGQKQLDEVDTTLMLNQLQPMDELFTLFQQNDPRFVALELMVEQSEAELRMVKHQGLPELSIGYETEKTDAEHFAGFRAGLSIPLWGNSGKRKAASVHLNAARLDNHSQKIQLEAEFEQLYQRAENTKSRLDELKNALTDFSNVSLLQRAFEAGQVSVIDLFNEITFLYGITDRVLELELEYAKCFAELHRFEL